MDFKISFYMLVSFLVGFILAEAMPFYIGPDEEKYKKASCGILLRRT